MKRRACRHYCESCNLSFETWDRYSLHILSRGHTANELPNASNDIQLFSEEPVPHELVSDDNDCFYLNNEYRLELGDENFNVVSSDENDLSDSDNISETSERPRPTKRRLHSLIAIFCSHPRFFSYCTATHTTFQDQR